MVDLSRRLFLGGTLAIAGATVLSVKPAQAVPILYGDGVHDDTAALQALFDGKPVTIDDTVITEARTGRLIGGHYLISSAIHLRGTWELMGCNFIGAGNNFGPALHFHEGGSYAGSISFRSPGTEGLWVWDDHDTTANLRALPAASVIVT